MPTDIHKCRHYRGVASLKHKVSEDSPELKAGFEMKAEDLTPV